MHILTNEGLRKAEQVEVQCILANLYNDLAEASCRVAELDGVTPGFTFGYLEGISDAQDGIRKILDTYDDPDFIHDMLDGQED